MTNVQPVPQAFNVMNYQPMCVACHRVYDKPTCIRGEDHPDAKLTEDNIHDIRKRYVEGMTQVALATEFGVRQGTISKIILRKTWKGVLP